MGGSGTLDGSEADRGWRTLEVYVAPGCVGCETARRLVREIVRQALPRIRVQLVDLGEPDAVRDPAVFAVPTYLLDGRVLSLGNPDLDWLLARLDGAA